MLLHVHFVKLATNLEQSYQMLCMILAEFRYLVVCDELLTTRK